MSNGINKIAKRIKQREFLAKNIINGSAHECKKAKSNEGLTMSISHQVPTELTKEGFDWIEIEK